MLPIDLQSIQSRILSPTKRLSAEHRAATPVRVGVGSVRAEDVPILLSGIGTVQAYNTVNVKTRVDGEIARVIFQEGQDVKAGEPIVIIDPRPYEAQLQQQEAMRLKDQALLDSATQDLQRYQTLAKTSAVSQQLADNQRWLVDQYRAQVQNDVAQIYYARTQLDYATIRSPISGRMGIRLVDQGNIVKAADNATIVVITQLQPISVVFTLAAASVAQARLTLGQAHVPVMAFAADDVALLDRGTVDLVDNQVDQTTGTIKLKASFPNAELRLWPGDFVNGRLVVDTRRQGLTVPTAAVRHGPRGDYVWVVRGDNTVQARAVSAGQRTSGRTLIERGLRRDEQVVTEGHFLLEDGSHIEIVKTDPGQEQANPRIAADPE
jgi:multidrug efflux system membrane fusion protein